MHQFIGGHDKGGVEGIIPSQVVVVITLSYKDVMNVLVNWMTFCILAFLATKSENWQLHASKESIKS